MPGPKGAVSPINVFGLYSYMKDKHVNHITMVACERDCPDSGEENVLEVSRRSASRPRV